MNVHCPECDEIISVVIPSKNYGTELRRVVICPKCGARFMVKIEVKTQFSVPGPKEMK